jgi:hypothetical protein
MSFMEVSEVINSVFNVNFFLNREGFGYFLSNRPRSGSGIRIYLDHFLINTYRSASESKKLRMLFECDNAFRK